MTEKKTRSIRSQIAYDKKALFIGRTNKGVKLTEKELDVLWGMTASKELHIYSAEDLVFGYAQYVPMGEKRVLRVTVHESFAGHQRRTIEYGRLYGDQETELHSYGLTRIYRSFLQSVGMYNGSEQIEQEKETSIWEMFYV